MLMRIFVALIIIIAIAVGIFALVLPRDQLVKLIVFRDFFDVTLPILAFGALVKYLCTCCHHHNHCHDKKD
ncbi:hypothetical protein [Aquicella lusitana]|uniref:Uncharacterized protein n=1 Tax=Aquicella lusitana TaxID=254246 RepID=A0A370G830_9COXI|nr:hypothetical protein [Aquicella lusitana]RDI39079.1 hypothetical protein C8D86_1284 [Aquicella lusitana]VVC73478.1 hypothetical protein AQULUS_12180 [Aquicella lusitana]